jgi:uncharacterized protein
VVRTGDIVKVRVVEVDLARSRIALTMKLDAAPAARGGDAASFRPAARHERAPRSAPQAEAPNAMAAAFAKLQRR